MSPMKVYSVCQRLSSTSSLLEWGYSALTSYFEMEEKKNRCIIDFYSSYGVIVFAYYTTFIKSVLNWSRGSKVTVEINHPDRYACLQGSVFHCLQKHTKNLELFHQPILSQYYFHEVMLTFTS